MTEKYTASKDAVQGGVAQYVERMQEIHELDDVEMAEILTAVRREYLVTRNPRSRVVETWVVGDES